jgi:hypothetical protein
MNAFEIQQSLPKRPNLKLGHDPETGTVNENGHVIGSGQVAGIVVFPLNYGARGKISENGALLRTWIERCVRTTVGINTATAERIVHARPDSVSALHLEETTGEMETALRRAIPPPKRKS